MSITNAQVLNILKSVYPNVRRASLRSQTSTAISKIPIKRWDGGKELRFSLSNGTTDVGSNWGDMISAGGDVNDLNGELVVTPRYLSTSFTVDMAEQLSTASDVGAYQEIVSDRMFTAFKSLNDSLAVHFYGGQYGVLLAAPALTLTTTGNVITVPNNVALYLQPGVKFRVAQNTYGGAFYPGLYTVTNNDGATVTFNSTSTDTWTTDDFIEVAFNRNGADATGPEGLLDIFPSLGNRTGAAWDTYIQTPYRNVNRSISPNQYAGQFSDPSISAADFKYGFALQEMLMKTKNFGAAPGDLEILLSPTRYLAVAKELQLYGQYNTLEAVGRSEIRGKEAIGAAFGELVVPYITMDPWAPDDITYFVPTNDSNADYYDMGALDRVILPQSQIGKQSPTDVGNQGISPELINRIANKLFTITTSDNVGVYGPRFRVGTHLFTNLVIRDTSRGGLVKWRS